MSYGTSWYNERAEQEALNQAGGVSRQAIPEPAVGVVRRTCPRCHNITTITITDFPDGSEVWSCHSCNGVATYRVR